MPVPAIRIDVDGTVTYLADAEYQTINDGVGGYIEAAPTSDDLTIYINEEGKLDGLPFNPLANALWANYDEYGCIAAGDFLVGPAVIVGPVDDEGESTPVPQAVIEVIDALSAAWEDAR